MPKPPISETAPPREALKRHAAERAYSYAKRSGVLQRTHSVEELTRNLEPWYLKTRFAYRIPLQDIIDILLKLKDEEDIKKLKGSLS